MTLAQWSNLFVYASMAMYALAMVAFAASFASARVGAAAVPASTRRGAGTPATAGADADSDDLAVVAAARDSAAGVDAASEPDASSGPGAAARARAQARSASGSGADLPRTAATEPLPPGRRAGNIGMSLTWLAFALLVVALITRAAWAGRAPWGNMYEFSLASAAAITGVFLVVSLRRDVRWMGLLVVMASLITLGVAVLLLYNDSPQLVPALKSYWLVIHVSAAIVAGGAFTVGAAATVLYLAADRAERDSAGTGPKPLSGWRGSIRSANSGAAAWVAARVPDAASLDAMAYRVNAFVFPLWTFAVIAGAIWAEDAWGRYWGWDPKETWAFITWLVYAGYLHARATAGWRGRKAAMIGLVGFACFLINFFGVNLFASGLHSYAGV
ncbi:MAG: c-type cytochrome biogenesis protein CcsB [Actinomycetota bacterium]|nr:c-type cytochrome biogenesis protein CcsB [Actinomycetota bacterium]MDH4017757.1 c-type cytochrome biogenesis protein CcsB [Actinomycetota bacterium]